MQRLSSWLIGLLALAVFAAAGYVVTQTDPVPDAGTVLPVATDVAPTGSASATPTDASTDAVPATGRVLAFLGDDWTAGAGASTRAKRFTSLVAGRLGATERNFGVDGTGYAKASSDDGAFDARIDAVVAADPDLVVVAGGRNDTSDYLPTLRSRVKALFADLHRRLPEATLVAIAPMWGDSAAPAELAPVAAAVQRYVTAAGGTYVDLADPILGHPDFMADAADPNDQGHAAIAGALTPKLRELLS